MGLIIPQLITPFGNTVERAYLNIAKDQSTGVIFVRDSDEPDMYYIVSDFRIYVDKLFRETGMRPLLTLSCNFTVPKADFGNVFTHIYAELKRKYPDAVDDI
jgi:hypothetical protein